MPTDKLSTLAVLASRLTEIGIEGAHLSWDRDARVLRVRYKPGSEPGSEAASMVLPTVEHWADGGSFGVLLDARGHAQTSRDWREAWADFFREHRARVRVALHHERTASRALLTADAWARSLDARAFATEAEARAWLAMPALAA